MPGAEESIQPHRNLEILVIYVIIVPVFVGLFCEDLKAYILSCFHLLVDAKF